MEESLCTEGKEANIEQQKKITVRRRNMSRCPWGGKAEKEEKT